MTEEKRTVHLEVCLQILNINYEVVDGVVKVYYNTVTDELKKILFPPFNLLTHNLVYEAVERVEEVLNATRSTERDSKRVSGDPYQFGVYWRIGDQRNRESDPNPIQKWAYASTRFEAEMKGLEKIISVPELAKLLEEG